MKGLVMQWRLLAGALALAIVAAGVTATVRGEGDKNAPKKADAPKAPAPPKAPKPPRALTDIDDLLKQLPAAGLDDNALKEMQTRMEEFRKQTERMMQQMQQQQQGMWPLLPRLGRGARGRMGRLEPFGSGQELRLGAQVSTPSKTLEDQLDLPKNQGMVLEEVGANSAAAKAGLKAHDILLELGGKPVSSKPDEFATMIKEVKPNTPIDAVVMRKGKKETIKGLSLPEAKAVARQTSVFPEMPAMPALPPLPAFRGLRGLGALGGLNGLNGSTSISRSNDEFTAKHESDGVKITLKGKLDEGKAKVSEIQIESNGKKNTYQSVDKVPAEYKEKVKKLTEMSARGGIDLLQLK